MNKESAALNSLCPACGGTLIGLEYREIELDYCPDCRGCWLDAGELEFLLGTGVNDPGLAWLRTGGKKGKRRCPRCSHALRERRAVIAADVCPAGDGLWLDDGELKLLAQRHAAAGALGPLVEFCETVFGNKTASEKEKVK